jgi:adenine-specific DNA-methyltransferase
VIGNPPYVKEYTNREIFEPIKQTELRRYYQGKMDIWYLFACRSIDLLKVDGLHSFIAQNNWITSYGASILRDKVLNDTKIVSFLDFGDYKVFEDADIQTMIYVLRKNKQSGSYKIEYRRVLEPNLSKTQIIEVLNVHEGIKGKSEFLEVDFNPNIFVGKEINFLENDNAKILDKIAFEGKYKLSSKEITTGIDIHQDFVINEHLAKLNDPSISKGDGIFVVSKKEAKEMNLSNDEWQLLKPYYTTRELLKYYGNSDNQYFVIYSKSDMNKRISSFPNIKKHLDKFKDIITSDFAPYGLHRARKQEFFEGEKIISLRKTREPHFTYTDFPTYVSQTFFVIKPKDVNKKFLTGILNSKVVYFWLKNKGKKQGNLLQIDKQSLLDIPISLASDKSLENEIIGCVDRIIEYIKKIISSTSRSEKELFQNKVKIEEEKLNGWIFKLYGLEETFIHKICDYLDKSA